ncbi:MAG: hypothetical protein A3B11_00700 [Candidatus Taylorbacteria bacterium RIFCSPLOWO2_01_FULL_44_26]|uniref:Nudix hydrolase domain-containing protein n=2 Tax=Candidatus Tayloriibacteriota TaxID=1817919 RepID=A0A1G2MLA1_9BACT|nr:MAG: hypothetical protein A3D50_00615 [Candidatus Taylorbacteria bacterium RIFCSPHIGHO2_02_FULL_44_12]OHA31202.1 MAG: hypothetical protein A3B11_00700 [Candidatus Taylorbacteria bacterium RIFCSPLOWO2_01_FULL_44_26]
MEEVGCKIGEIEEIAIADEYRIQRGRQITHFFVAKLIGEKGLPQTTQADEIDLEIEWLTLDDAIVRLQREKDLIPLQSYNYHFNVRTHLAFLESLRKNRFQNFKTASSFPS